MLLIRVKFRIIIISLMLLGGITYAYNQQIYEAISKNDSISTRGDLKEHLISVTNVQSDASNTERLNRWLCAWRMAVDKPITGYGPGMYQFEYGKFQERGHMTRISTFSGNKGHAHSEYFTQLSETGFPGFVLFLLIVFSVIGYGMTVIYREKDRRNKLLLYGAVLGLVTFYVHGVFNAFLDMDKMAVLVFGSIAIIVAADLRQKRVAKLT
jgi:putative inorganic carbon (hco3(-)) transporter